MKYTILLFFSFYCLMSFGQEDKVLFTVNNTPVHVSEFDYIYLKNNGDKADYSEESLKEYLELYEKFKLKVEQAKEMGLDTVQRLNQELEGYRKQLASSYLVDKEVSEKLVDEVVARKKLDVKVSHIFVSSPKGNLEETQQNAETKIRKIYNKLKAGNPFEEMAKSLSDDKTSGMKGGMLGYYTATLPDGFYEFENAMYNTPVGELSEPVKSNMGWHILKIHDKRKARGESEISHIFLQKKKDGREIKTAKANIDSLHALLLAGANFQELAKAHSQDAKTADKGGYLGSFKINQYEAIFENTAFEMKIGDYSNPIESSKGYHIILKHGSNQYEDELKVRRQVQAGLSKTERFGAAKMKLVENIKEQSGVKENKILLSKFIAGLDKEFYSYKWQVPTDLPEDDLLTIADQTFNLTDFASHCKLDSRARLRNNKSVLLEDAVNSMYSNFVSEKILNYEETQLPKKYPEFKSLMREYEEGILLFEATKMEVWDKAGIDTVGLEAFYEKNKENYKWEENLTVDKYTIQSDDKKLAKSIFKKSKKASDDTFMSGFNYDDYEIIKKEELTINASDENAQEYQWTSGFNSKLLPMEDSYTFYKVKQITPSKLKKLNEARGYIIADYQDELERRWIKDLKSKFPIELNTDVFNALIKS